MRYGGRMLHENVECQNKGRPTLKKKIYILRVELMHRIVRRYINALIHIDVSLHPYFTYESA